MSDLLIRQAEVRDGVVMDVRVSQGCVAAIGTSLPQHRDDETVDAKGGALLPGLHDHHIHLFALAAANASAKCGPPEVRTREDLTRALAAAPRLRDWIRGVFAGSDTTSRWRGISTAGRSMRLRPATFRYEFNIAAAHSGS
ncbi:MAG: amidohydrolase family protein [Deltaproteobacteria bacterium]|nr:amidohydrolase family protein [Deltaproteobacteria bacterium]